MSGVSKRARIKRVEGLGSGDTGWCECLFLCLRSVRTLSDKVNELHQLGISIDRKKWTSSK